MFARLDWNEQLSSQVPSYVFYNPMLKIPGTSAEFIRGPVAPTTTVAASNTVCQAASACTTCPAAGVATVAAAPSISCTEYPNAAPRVALYSNEPSVLLNEIDFTGYYLSKGDQLRMGGWNRWAVNSRSVC